MGGMNECTSILTAFLFLLVILSECSESKDLLLVILRLGFDSTNRNHRALCQGMASAVPKSLKMNAGFSP
jgi:hypothetical protein